MDDIPDFHVDNADPALIKGDPGDAFQQFVLELFLDDRPQLRRYLGAGKDGGIDLSEPSAGTLKVMECKYMGSGDLAEALKRWKVTAGNLERNLGGPDGPPKGQGQYQPWYEPDPAIVEYLFVINQMLKTEGQRNTLRKKIRAVFDQLSSLPHLSHLAGIRIDIVDGGELRSRLQRNEHIVHRWFPATRPISGLAELDAGERRGFRIYLYDEKLPHYRLADHISAVPPPAGVEIQDELAIFDRLERNACVGLVISGAGGMGKTRLTLELGRIARDRSWVVFRVVDLFDLDEVARRVRPEKPILFVFDYLENQRDSAVLLERIISRNRDEGRRMHFVASCRTSYLRSVRQLADVHYVDLSPRAYSPSQRWLDGYRRAAVRAILAQGNIGATKEALRTCQDIPVLAVFLCYLKDSDRDTDLNELLGEENFGRWVAKRVQLSFGKVNGKVNIDIDLAALISLFPMPSDRVAQLKADTEAPIFNILAQDGWIERGGTVDVAHATAMASATEGTWEVLHDVLADQILTQHFADNEFIAGALAARLLQRAGELGLTRSCLESFQRVREESPLLNLPWEDLLSAAIAAFPGVWQTAREEVIRTSLLDEAARIRLLGAQSRLWEGAETQLNMHYALAWIIHERAEFGLAGVA